MYIGLQPTNQPNIHNRKRTQQRTQQITSRRDTEKTVQCFGRNETFVDLLLFASY